MLDKYFTKCTIIKWAQNEYTYTRHWPQYGHPAGVVIDGEEARRIFSYKVFHFSIVCRVSVIGVHLFHPLAHRTLLLYGRWIVREVEDGRVVVLVPDFCTKRAEPS